MTNSIKPKIQFEPQQILPIGSYMLVFICAFMFWQSATAGNDSWIMRNCFVVKDMSELFQGLQALLTATFSGRAGASELFLSNLGKFMAVAFNSTFASLDRVQVFGNVYFLYVFGACLEQRIGNGRFILLVLLSLFVPWPFVLFESGKLGLNACYFGPFFLLCTLLGATFVFPPERKINTEWFKSSRGNIFATEPRADMTAKYQFKPTFFMGLFICYEGFMVWLLSHSHPELKVVGIIPGVAALLTGYIIVSVLVWSATGSLKDGPLRLMAVKMYNDILKLDVGHEMAIKGTSMALGLPPERIREWITAQRGKMSIS